MSSSEEFLKEMAQLTMLTGRISEVHYKNMQNFPFIYFNQVATVEIDYTIATNRDDESWVHYKIKSNIENDEHLETRCKSLEAAIKHLFWKEVKTSITLNGVDAYKSE